MKNKQKLYCYVDETGQDTGGIFFIVGLLILGPEREKIESKLRLIEADSKKRTAKWTDAHYLYRRHYIDQVLQLRISHLLFCKYFGTGKEYLLYTAEAIIEALRTAEKTTERATIYVDGFPLSQVQQLKRQIKPSLNMRIYVKSIARDESSPLMRLADSICGLVRDSNEENDWARKMVTRLEQNHILKRL